MTETDDPFRDYMDKTLTKLNDQIDKAFQPWVEAGEEAEKLLNAAQEFSAASVIAGIRGTLSEIDLWYRQQMDEFATALCKEMGIPFTARFSDHEPGWVTTAVQFEVAAINSALIEFKEAAIAYSELVDKHSGVTGFLKDAFRGFIDPVDGIAGLFGQSSVDKEYNQVQKLLNTSSTKIPEVQTALLNALDQAVVNRWNIKIEEIKNKIEQAAEEAEKARQVSPAIGSQPSFHRSPLIAVIFIVLLLAAISIGILALVSQHYSGKKSLEISSPAAPAIGMIHLSKDTRIRKGPSVKFGGLAVLEEDTNATVLDKSVPGWLKIRTDFGLEGWIKDDTKMKR